MRYGGFASHSRETKGGALAHEETQARTQGRREACTVAQLHTQLPGSQQLAAR
eukprot:COSAG06_NODE_1087_length_10749_cov_1130.191174_11_plen_53_part_00